MFLYSSSQELASPRFAPVLPELPKLFFEEVGISESFVRRQEPLESPPFRVGTMR